MGTSSAFLCLDPLPLLPSLLHSSDLISPAACCRDTHRNRWLQSNMCPFQGCSPWSCWAGGVRHSEVTNNGEMRNCDALIYLKMTGIHSWKRPRMWRWWSAAIMASLAIAIGGIWNKYGTYGCFESPTSKLTAKHLLTWCSNDLGLLLLLLLLKIDEVQLRCSKVEPGRQPGTKASCPVHPPDQREKRVKVGLKEQEKHFQGRICTFFCLKSQQRQLVWIKNKCVFTEVRSSAWLRSSCLEV